MAHKTDASSSTGATSKAITASTKIKIQQDIPNNSIKKGPYAIDRTLDPYDVIINRRCGEGSKPLFLRKDIIDNNRHQSNDLRSNIQDKAGQRYSGRISSSPSSSEESYHHNDAVYSAAKTTTSTAAKLKHKQPQRTVDKKPYFLDEKREEERLMRMYGTSNPNDVFKKKEKLSKKRRNSDQRRAYSRSRSRSPPKSHSSHMKYSSPNSSQKSKHSKHQRYSPEQYYSHSRYRLPESGRQRYRSLSSDRRTRHYRRSKSRSRSRSRSNDYHKRARSSDRRDGGHQLNANKPTTQIITIPVPVDPYGYHAAYPTWPHQPAWPAATPAPRYPAPYPMPPMMPPYIGPPIYPPYRPPPPPPYRMPYAPPRLFRPPRFAMRQPRTNFRPRNH